jgi:glycine hydroxymethyltransferase
MVLCKEQYATALNKIVLPGIQGGPLMHIIAAKAVCFKEAMAPEFKSYQQQIVKNAAAMAEGLKANGFRLVSGGTDNHLMLVDLTSKNVTGKQAEVALDQVGITVNKNMIPFDTQKPLVTSGIRVGTPAVTTRGMKESEMKVIADLINRGVEQMGDEAAQTQIRSEVRALCSNYPLYPGM